MGILNFFKKDQLVGLDIGVSGIKAVELLGGERPRLVGYNRIPFPRETILEGEMRNRPVILAALKKLFSGRIFTSKSVVVGISGHNVITKRISLPKMSKKDLNNQLYWEAEQYIPFNINEVNLDYAILDEGQEGTETMDILLVAAKKEFIESITSLIKEAGLTPDIIDIQSFALGNVFEFNYGGTLETPDGSANIIIDFGAGSTKISVVEKDKTTFSSELNQGGDGCTALISVEAGVPIDEAELLKMTTPHEERVKGIVEQFLESLSSEILRTIDFYLSQNTEKMVHGIYYCGGASRLSGLIHHLKEKMPAPVHALNPIQNIAGSGKKMNRDAIRELSYLGAVGVGLALRSLKALP